MMEGSGLQVNDLVLILGLSVSWKFSSCCYNELEEHQTDKNINKENCDFAIKFAHSHEKRDLLTCYDAQHMITD